jgi:hypothetical protein
VRVEWRLFDHAHIEPGLLWKTPITVDDDGVASFNIQPYKYKESSQARGGGGGGGGGGGDGGVWRVEPPALTVPAAGSARFTVTLSAGGVAVADDFDAFLQARYFVRNPAWRPRGLLGTVRTKGASFKKSTSTPSAAVLSQADCGGEIDAFEARCRRLGIHTGDGDDSDDEVDGSKGGGCGGGGGGVGASANGGDDGGGSGSGGGGSDDVLVPEWITAPASMQDALLRLSLSASVVAANVAVNAGDDALACDFDGISFLHFETQPPVSRAFVAAAAAADASMSPTSLSLSSSFSSSSLLSSSVCGASLLAATSALNATLPTPTPPSSQRPTLAAQLKTMTEVDYMASEGRVDTVAAAAAKKAAAEASGAGSSRSDAPPPPPPTTTTVVYDHLGRRHVRRSKTSENVTAGAVETLLGMGVGQPKRVVRHVSVTNPTPAVLRVSFTAQPSHLFTAFPVAVATGDGVGGDDANGGEVLLPPGGNCAVAVMLTPPSPFDTSAWPLSPRDAGSEGSLLIHFDNGVTQTLPLRARLCRPEVHLTLKAGNASTSSSSSSSTSAPNLSFGTVFCRATARSIAAAGQRVRLRRVTLTNPSDADAAWAFMHVQRERSNVRNSLHPRTLRRLANTEFDLYADTIDDPSVFRFSVSKGVLAASSLAMAQDTPTAAPLLPDAVAEAPTTVDIEFRPARAGVFVSRFRLVTGFGDPLPARIITLRGVGSLDEAANGFAEDSDDDDNGGDEAI